MSRSDNKFRASYNIFAGMAIVAASLRGLVEAKINGTSLQGHDSVVNSSSEGGYSYYNENGEFVYGPENHTEETSTIWYDDMLPPEEGKVHRINELQSLSREDFLAIESAQDPDAIDLSDKFRRYKGKKSVTHQMTSDVVDEKGSVRSILLGGGENYRGTQRFFKIAYNTKDFPAMPPVFIPNHSFKVTELKSGTPVIRIESQDGHKLNVKISAKSPDGDLRTLNRYELDQIKESQDAIATSNEARRGRNFGDPVSGKINLMAGIDYFSDPNAILDLEGNMPLAPDIDEVTIDIADHCRLAPIHPVDGFVKGLVIRYDIERFGSRIPVNFVDGDHRVVVNDMGGGLRITSPEGGVVLNVGIEVRNPDQLYGGVDIGYFASFAQEHNRRYGPRSSPNPSPQPESAAAPDQEERGRAV